MNYDRPTAPAIDVRCFKLERPKNHRFRHRSVPDRARLLLVKRGSITVRSDEQAVTANQGEYISIPSGMDTVAEYTGEDNCVLMLSFSGFFELDSAEIKLYVRNSEAAVLMESAFEETESSPYRLPAILCGVLHHLALSGNARREGAVMHVVRYIENHCRENRRVDEYAAMAYLSESHFRKLFVAITGMSPIDYRIACGSPVS